MKTGLYIYNIYAVKTDFIRTRISSCIVVIDVFLLMSSVYSKDEKLMISSFTCRITALYLITTRVTYIPYRDVSSTVMLVSSPLQNKE
jgi:hypothetical protein